MSARRPPGTCHVASHFARLAEVRLGRPGARFGAKVQKTLLQHTESNS
jgi:hypothetical protein